MSTAGKVLLTGTTGFLGQVLRRQLTGRFSVVSLGRSTKNDIICDLSTRIPVIDHPYEFLIHNAGWAHRIPRTETESEIFWSVNRDGTQRLLKAFEEFPPAAMVLISTVAVYGREKGEMITEAHETLGQTPYAASKLAGEQLWREWAEQRSVPYLILRLPLVAGPDPPGNLGAMAAAIRKGYYFRIGQNSARKSIVRADDIGIVIHKWLTKGEKISGIFNLTDDCDPTFAQIEEAIALGLQKKIRWQIPLGIIRSLAKLGDLARKCHLPAPLHSDKLKKMTTSLTFNCKSAKEHLNWKPRPALEVLADTDNWQNE